MVYRKAAKIAYDNSGSGACVCICTAAKEQFHLDNELVSAYAELFSPAEKSTLVWGIQWADVGGALNIHWETITSCRAISLLLMSEIAKDAESGRKRR